MNRFLILSFVFASLAWNPPTAQSAKLHAIIAVDALQEDVGREILESANRLAIELIVTIPQHQLSLWSIGRTRPLTRNHIINTINNLTIETDDAVLFYYIGHGYYDATKQVTCLRLSGDPRNELSWQDISQELSRKTPRLNVVVLDCCNREDAPDVAPDKGYPAPFVPATEITPLCDQLFFQSKGTVVLISSSPHEFALVKARTLHSRHSVPEGAIFTNAFWFTIAQFSDRSFSWIRFTEKVQTETDKLFLGLVGQDRTFFINGVQFQQDRQTARLVVNNQLIRLNN
jgi:hypothetical protein